jgi:hypothetical protein
MYKGLGMAMALLGAMGGVPVSGKRYYVRLQSAESKKFHLDRAAEKRARKGRILQARAARGDIGTVTRAVEAPKKARATRAKKVAANV